MTQIIKQHRDKIFSATTPEIIVSLFEWSQRNLQIMDDEFVKLTPHLTLTNAVIKDDKPPEFLLVGKQSAARSVFGDKWADSIRQTQQTPINNLESHSAEGYLEAEINGFNYDIVAFDTGNVRGLYHRLIIPVSKCLETKPTYFAMLPVPIDIERSGARYSDFYTGIIDRRRTLH